MRVLTDRASIIVAFLVLWIGTTTALAFYGVKIDRNTRRVGANEVKIAAQARTLHTSQLRACHRLNLIRAEDNRSQLKDFDLFSLTGKLIAGAVAHPRQVMTAKEAGVVKVYLARINEDVLGKEWTPLTDCARAVNEPFIYPSPEPIPFSYQRPSSKALVVGPGE